MIIELLSRGARVRVTAGAPISTIAVDDFVDVSEPFIREQSPALASALLPSKSLNSLRFLLFFLLFSLILFADS